MTTLLTQFYQLPLESIAQCFLLLSLIFLFARRRYAHCRWFRMGVWVTLAIWVAATLWITIFNRTPGSTSLPALIPFHSYRKLFATGSKDFFRSNFMNVALFYPAGLLTASQLPEKWSRIQKILFSGILLGLFSFMIEYTQFLYALGEPEIDDVLHNTLGAICGTIPIAFKEILR